MYRIMERNFQELKKIGYFFIIVFKTQNETVFI